MWIWYPRLKETGIISSYSSVSTMVWLHFLESNETLEEKAKWELTTQELLRDVLNKSWKKHNIKQ